MASPANVYLDATAEEEIESDYGSDFSPEEQDIVNTLLSSFPAQIETVEDNPIVNEIEYHEPPSTLRVPRTLGRERGVDDARSSVGFGAAAEGSGHREQSHTVGRL